MFRNRTLWGLAAWISLALPVTSVILWPDTWWPLIFLAFWTLAIGTLVVMMERRIHREHCERLLTRAQSSAIKTLSHHRHDWMNELQILYGYLRLNKPDKAVDVVDRIRARMEQDSRISQIGVTELASFLLSFRTVCDTMRLDVDIQDGLYLDRMPYAAEKLSKSIIGLVNVFRFRAASPSGGENVLKMAFYRQADELSIAFEYEGELAAADSVTEELARCVEGIGQIDQGEEPAEQTRQARTMVIHFPLPA
ncbi:Spo0B domain-containing protein [Cohnella endophytica]|nr:Spo0B domain-containing protein [Cohnella endophytica]